MIEKMMRYSFALLSGEADKFLKDLEELGVVDITRSEKPVDDASTKLSNEVETCRKAISYLESLNPAEEADNGKFTLSPDGNISDPLALFQEILPKERLLKTEIDELQNNLDEARVWEISIKERYRIWRSSDLNYAFISFRKSPMTLHGLRSTPFRK